MNKKEFVQFRDDCLMQLIRWATRGGKLGTYFCNHCKKDIPCRIPDKKDVSEKGYWDSATTCLECGKHNFVAEYPSGKTTSKKLPF